VIPTTGTFDYVGEGCIPVCIPEGLTVDGLPIMIFPPEGGKIITQEPYQIKFTTEGTKTREVEGKTYRIGRCIGATLQDQDEENFL
jgi:hypothetical protein